MKRSLSLAALSLVVLLLARMPAPAEAAPEGQLTLALQVALAPAWFDPADTSGIITPFWILYALHDALVKPMPGKPWQGLLLQNSANDRERSERTDQPPDILATGVGCTNGYANI